MPTLAACLLPVMVAGVGRAEPVVRRRGQEAMAAAEEQRELGSVVAEGLAKLVMHQSQWRADSQGRMEDSEISQVSMPRDSCSESKSHQGCVCVAASRSDYY